MIELILLERVEKLGQMGQMVKVRPGFARNYLLPQKKALRATKDNLAYFETQRAQLEANNLQRKAEAGEVGGKLEGLTVVIIRQAGESGQLYGSVVGPRHRRGGHRGGLHDRKAPSRARPADQEFGPASAADRASSGSLGHGHRQRRPVGRGGQMQAAASTRCGSVTKTSPTRKRPRHPRLPPLRRTLSREPPDCTANVLRLLGHFVNSAASASAAVSSRCCSRVFSRD